MGKIVVAFCEDNLNAKMVAGFYSKISKNEVTVLNLSILNSPDRNLEAIEQFSADDKELLVCFKILKNTPVEELLKMPPFKGLELSATMVLGRDNVLKLLSGPWYIKDAWDQQHGVAVNG